ncbi:unnamed protein product (macronuclear) [Paramecium tetraurelia]|uniref:Uncharacterized protein n=1 Tax=Paramecium tetraurelia TaxID=5888 RepID=A0EEM1_PARTE|nr:uncharacterized protein GSPATT00026084001 [Paramecium tetraurelia]CAK93760.1 unnamed protein product [Paramecium tetraurelia]|eukprot:XP_001461135.1 hypothetical protein (macronuclear) [Paramecium tetraurelia strain d4-2]
MITSRMTEKEEEILQCAIHKEPNFMVSSDPRLNKKQRLLCRICIDSVESNESFKIFKQVKEKIEANQNQRKLYVENVVRININYIEQIRLVLIELKNKVAQNIEKLMGFVDQWIQEVLKYGEQNATYSFFDELEKLIIQKNNDQFNQESLIEQIHKQNQSKSSKINTTLTFFKSFQETKQCEELLKSIQHQGNQRCDAKRQQEMNQIAIQQEQLEQQQQMIAKKIELKQIDNSNQSSGYCFAIVFDKTGSIMVSCESPKIQIWNIEKGKLKLINTYSQHQETVRCLVYSKLRNSFISGSIDHTLICWQQINKHEWKYSQPYQNHLEGVNCLMLNKEEDQVISGSCDKYINVWKVDFMKNQLTFLYTLNNHENSVESLSFNSNETQLVSCGFDEFIVWEQGLSGKWEFQYKQSVANKGYKIHLINDQLLIWVTMDADIDDILVFELQRGVFQQNANKTIKLTKNNKSEDDMNFSIVHNLEKNILLIRHKYHIYFFRQLIDGTLKVYKQLNCQVKQVFGSMTNNGEYLVFWDRKKEKYQTYEILNI